MFLSKCTVCDSKISRFIKEQKASEFLSNTGLETPLGKIPLIGDTFFLKTDIK